MPKEAKSEALRKKMEEETTNVCKECGSKRHKTKDHKVEKPNKEKKSPEDKEEREVEKEEEKE